MSVASSLRSLLHTPQALRHAGVLGINARNHSYMLRVNPRSLFPRVDDKLLTKKLCERAGIPTARVLGVARWQAHVPKLLDDLDSHPSFVLKPAHGAMGNGIIVVRERTGDTYRAAGGRTLKRSDLAYHASSILSGLFALGGKPDSAYGEELLEVHPDLARISTDGVPDVRIVIFRGIPVMAMTRLPTRISRGRANLHQGAVGAGVDLTTGRTNHAVVRNRPVELHPDSRERVVGREIPGFASALEIAVRASDETELGYVGADVVVDARYGPVILELNARPGLAVQVANRAGLEPRLEAVEAELRPGASVAERIRLGQEIARRR